MVDARRAAGRDRPRAEGAVRRDRGPRLTRGGQAFTPAPLGALHAELQRQGAGEGQVDRLRRLILDLEDAVAPDAKPAARDAACAAAASGEYGRRELTIRVNGIGTEWHDDDLAAAARPARTGSSCPRSTAPTRSAPWSRRWRRPAPPSTPGCGRWSRRPRRSSRPRDRRRLRPARRAGDGHQRPGQGAVRRARARPAPLLTSLSLALLAARAAGIAILDGVYNDVKNVEGFLAECEQGRQMGFDGKTLIHPGQVEAANEAVRPERAGGRGRPRHPRSLGGRQGLRRRHLQRQDGGEPARGVRPAHPEHPRGDPGAAGLIPWHRVVCRGDAVERVGRHTTRVEQGQRPGVELGHPCGGRRSAGRRRRGARRPRPSRCPNPAPTSIPTHPDAPR